MSIIYVSPAGRDTNSGSLSSPLLTGQHAVDVAATGDLIEFVPGTWSPPFTDSSRPMILINTPGLTLRSLAPLGAVLDGGLRCHAPIWLGQKAQSTTIDGFTIKRGAHFGVHSNQLGGQNFSLLNCDIGFNANMVDNGTSGDGGFYCDTIGSGVISGNFIHDNGRTNQQGNAYDHGLYLHGSWDVYKNHFSAARFGWHIQIAAGFNGSIRSNIFDGPSLFPGKNGQVMLWDVCREVSIDANAFNNPMGYAIEEYAFSSTKLVVTKANTVTPAGTPIAGPGSVSLAAWTAAPAVGIDPVAAKALAAKLMQDYAALGLDLAALNKLVGN